VSTDRYTFVRSVRDSRLDSSLPREIAPGLSAIGSYPETASEKAIDAKPSRHLDD